MRVTNNMMADQVIFNTQRAIRRFMDLQTDMSSGRRINKPSDDPLGTLRDLGYRTELSKIGQYRRNISQGLNWQTTYDSVLADVKDLLSEAKEVAIAMSNGTYDAIARQGSATEVQSIFDQVVQLAHSQLEGRQIFSGFRTKTKPLDLTGNGVVYRGDDGKIEFEIESSIRQIINLTGAEVFLKPFTVLGQDADLNVGLTGATLLADLNAGRGVDLATGTFTVTDLNLNLSSTIDISAATTVDEAMTTINSQLSAGGIGVTVSLGVEGNNLQIETNPTNFVTSFTKLSKLNDGQGVDLNPGSIRVTDGAGTTVLVDLSGATTVGDIITAFNTQMAAAGLGTVSMSLNMPPTAFVIDDINVPPLGLTIEDVTIDEQTASQLGIAGFIGSGMVGGNLNPEASFEIADTTGTTAADLGITGMYSSQTSGTDIDPRLTLTSNLADLRNFLGLDDTQFVIWQGERSLTVDLSDTTINTVQDLLDHINNSGLDVTASINSSGRGIQIENDDPNRSLTIEEEGSQRTARQMGIYGSSDMMGTLLVLINALKGDDQEGIGLLLQSLDEAITVGLDNRATVGAAAMRLEATDSRLVDLDLSYTRLLSEVEDADLTKVVTDLSTYENNYRAALQAASRIIQPSLLDFLQ